MKNKWTVNDFITLAIFNMVMFIAWMIGAMTNVFLGELVSQVISGLLATPFMLIMANKVNKRGVFLLSALCMGIFMAVLGMVYYMIIYIVFSIVAELICWRNGSYQNPVKLTIGMIFYQISYVLAGVFPLFMFRQQYLKALASSYTTPESLNHMLYYYETPSMIAAMCAMAVVGVIIGGFIGNSLLNRHVKRAKLI
ncbi:MptD family putative ECF transporter S component [Lysinibacillus sp. FSL H8-0500]|uniref:MptD family putative ECF transporter S component n=1 Tax=Lysinibacillus sp. FSL H8-0500 TaxID=2921393 RepID=UPI003101A1CB